MSLRPSVPVVGIHGLMESGKTALARALKDALAQDRTGRIWLLASFADALKELCATAFSFPPEWNYSPEGKAQMLAETKLVATLLSEANVRRYTDGTTTPMLAARLPDAQRAVQTRFDLLSFRNGGAGCTVGQVLQTVGQIFRDRIAPTFWVHAAHKMIADACDWNSNIGIIIDDIRYANEYEFVSRCPHRFLVKVYRPVAPGRGAASTDRRDAGHPSEAGLPANLTWNSIVINDSTLEHLKEVGKMLAKHVISI